MEAVLNTLRRSLELPRSACSKISSSFPLRGAHYVHVRIVMSSLSPPGSGYLRTVLLERLFLARRVPRHDTLFTLLWDLEAFFCAVKNSLCARDHAVFFLLEFRLLFNDLLK